MLPHHVPVPTENLLTASHRQICNGDNVITVTPSVGGWEDWSDCYLSVMRPAGPGLAVAGVQTGPTSHLLLMASPAAQPPAQPPLLTPLSQPAIFSLRLLTAISTLRI